MANFYAKYPSTSVAVTISGTSNVQGIGTPGAQAGGVLTVQGDPAGTPIPISGTVSASNPSVGATGAAVPASATFIAGTNAGSLKGIACDASGNLGVLATQSGTWNINDITGTISLPTGASTEAKQDNAITLLTNIDVKTPNVGQAFMAASSPVVIASDQTAVPVSGSVTVSGTVAATQSGTWNVGRTWALSSGTDSVAATVSGSVTVSGTVAATQSGTWNIGTVTAVTAITNALPAGANVIGGVTQSGIWTTGRSWNLTSGADSVTATVSGSVTVSGTVAATQSGTWSVDAVQSGTWNIATVTAVTAITNALPAGANVIGGVTQSGTWNVGVTGTVTVSGTVAATQSGTWTVQPGNTANTTPWLTTINQGGNSATVTASNALKVDGSAVTQPVSVATLPAQSGRSYSDSARLDYSSTNVTTGAWVQVIASTAAAINFISIFDSSGQTMELGTGAAASETRKFIIPPGGITSGIPLAIPAGTRVSIRAISGTASVGEFDITGLQ